MVDYKVTLSLAASTSFIREPMNKLPVNELQIFCVFVCSFFFLKPPSLITA